MGDEVRRQTEPPRHDRGVGGEQDRGGAEGRVIMQEQASVTGDGAGVRFSHVPQPGEWVRREGEDIRAGSTILTAGRRLKPQDIGLLASVVLALVVFISLILLLLTYV